MSLLIATNGRKIVWTPTRELVCAYCQRPVERHTIWEQTPLSAYFVYDPERLHHGEYWYLHVRCLWFERHLQELGVIAGWASCPMALVFGLGPLGNDPGDTAQYIRTRLPQGIYEELYATWAPAIARKRPARRVTFAPPVEPEPRPPKSWGRLRWWVMTRDGYRCGVCGVAASDRPGVRLEVDHLVPRSQGGTDDPSNLLTMCRDCNQGKHVEAL